MVVNCNRSSKLIPDVVIRLKSETFPPGKKVRCKVLYNEFKAEVPYTATWQRKDIARCRRTEHGIFKEVSAFDMHMQVTESRVIVEVIE